jgi:hypothetical protein
MATTETTRRHDDQTIARWRVNLLLLLLLLNSPVVIIATNDPNRKLSLKNIIELPRAIIRAHAPREIK